MDYGVKYTPWLDLTSFLTEVHAGRPRVLHKRYQGIRVPGRTFFSRRYVTQIGV